MQFIVEVIVQ